MKLHSTSIAKSPGFELTFKEVSFDCGGKLILTEFENSTIINSPNYPNIPQPHIECIWIIRAPPGESIRFDFLERFDLTNSINCKDEYVELRDGAAVTSKLIGRFCDETLSSQSTSDNVLYIKFFTQLDVPRNGFKAKIQIKNCGGIIHATSGTITSPNYGLKEFYPENADCSWEIIGPMDHVLNVTFKEIDLPPRIGDCAEARIKIVEHFLKNNSKDIVDACRMKPELKNVQTFGNHITVKFTSGKIIMAKRFAGFSLSFVTDHGVCGGKLTSPSGYITSPGYPSMIPHQRLCKWIIEVSRGRRIKVKVIDLDLDKNSHTYEQGIVFFNDHDFYSEIEYLSAGDKADYVYSTDNVMGINFWTAHVSSHRGFKLQYSSDEPTLCVGDFSKEYGTIYTPKNVTLFRCSWSRDDDIHLQRTVTLKITSNSADRKPLRNCERFASNLDVKTKVNGETMLVAKYCNFVKKPETLRIPYPYILMININGEPYFESINYTVEYTTQNCGGIITKPIGTIQSPEFPNTPSTTYDCVWVIDLLENQAVKINFTFMDLGQDCEKNFVKIHNGPLKTSPLIGTFCGNSLPSTYISQSKGIWIEYHFDVASNGKGFQVNYEPVIGGCGGVFYDTNRFLQTPNYPEEYPNDIECVWELHTGDGYHVGLIFDKRFHLETSSNCENDFIHIYDFKNGGWELINVLCGKDPPSFINSTSTKMKVLFRSNSKISQAGFRASWSANCGGVFVADKNAMTISSPGYPNNYKSNLFCVYNISANRGNLRVEFLDFNLEHSDDNCIFDNVTLSYKVNRKFINNTYCSITTPPFIIVENNVIVTFRTDNYMNLRGFLLSYKTDECGGEITQPTIIQHDHKYNWDQTDQGTRFYGLEKPCVWNIIAPEKSQSVIVRLELLNLIYTFNCNANYLMFFDGLSQNSSNRLAKFCGNYFSIIHPENTPIISSTSNQMTIVYRDPSMRSVGFKALIYFSYGPSAGCGGKTYLNDTKTATIRGPVSLNELDCHYQIETMDGYYLSLKFIELDSCKLNTNGSLLKNCSCSFFEIRDGGGPLSEIIDSFCDQDILPTYKTTRAKVWIRWTTNLFNMGRGFKLEVTPILSVCGPSLLVAEKIPKVLVSPNFPQTYPGSTICSWKIVWPQNGPCCMHLKFIEFDLGDIPDDSTTCPGDKVEIRDKHNSDTDESELGSSTIFATRLNNQFISRIFYAPLGAHQYCGKSGHEYDYYAFSREAKIDFESVSGTHGKGFKLEYQIANCYRNLTGQQGKVKTKVEGTGCTILITAPIGTTVSVYFYNYYLEPSKTCKDDKIEMYDGPTTTSTKLATHCSGYPNPVFSTQNVVLIQITKRPNATANMLDFTYTSTDKGRGCGGKIYSYHGIITSPLYPQNFPNISDCVWEINVPYGLDVEIRFIQFSIPNRCDTDYVTITTYSNKISNEHRYCGNGCSPEIEVV
ncbi:cubilin homolog [Onthophagus taurus]|uniref:cubilin homolog n=1 Tax=Onthophagus taurus TaxID=166361 RepID=UPI0039BE3165